MKQRIITALLGCLVLFPVLYFSGTIVFPIACAACSLVGAYELCACFGVHKKLHLVVPTYLYAAAAPLLTHFLFQESTRAYLLFFSTLSFALILYYILACVFSRGDNRFSVLSQVAVSTIYVVVGFTSLALVRRGENGAYLFWLVFVGGWITDIMAYFTGYFFGKHKLCPLISPKKTIEGSIGGSLFCVLAFLLYGFILQRYFFLSPNYLILGISGLIISIISQIGDLSASIIKRENNIKDFGNILPGHGGIIDRFDSLLPVAPLLLFIFELYRLI
ncbi:MAG: phosphatidate cytidylyltransferase [Clostridia bacterium]|nr:phosphatidate cytidylyltransferase [Clostridia bacterium]